MSIFKKRGYLCAGDIRYLSENGIPIMKELQNIYGKNIEDINKMLHRREIKFLEVSRIINNLAARER